MATGLADIEQKQRVDAAKEDVEWTQAERKANQRRASKMLDAEQRRRVEEGEGATTIPNYIVTSLPSLFSLSPPLTRSLQPTARKRNKKRRELLTKPKQSN